MPIVFCLMIAFLFVLVVACYGKRHDAVSWRKWRYGDLSPFRDAARADWRCVEALPPRFGDDSVAVQFVEQLITPDYVAAEAELLDRQLARVERETKALTPPAAVDVTVPTRVLDRRKG